MTLRTPHPRGVDGGVAVGEVPRQRRGAGGFFGYPKPIDAALGGCFGGAGSGRHESPGRPPANAWGGATTAHSVSVGTDAARHWRGWRARPVDSCLCRSSEELQA